MSHEPPRDFIRDIIRTDLESGKHTEIVTRFPPEPNGYLHMGHVMSICLNFGVAAETGGRTFLRYDDTNPGKEDEEFVRAIERDVRWLGFDWQSRLTHASDYFETLYDAAVLLIDKGLAYVDSLSAEDIRRYRGTLTEPGTDSPYRERSVAENLDLFRRMRRRRVRRRRTRAAREDRHGLAQHEPARPDAVSHPAYRSSAHG